MKQFLGLILFFFLLSAFKNVQVDALECEVCEGVINKLRKNLPDDAKPEEIEIEFKRWCKTATGKEEKFVSYFNLLNLF
jgi:hypothetical protein